MGFSYAGVCYQSIAEASQAHCSSLPFVSGGVMYSCVRSSDAGPVVRQTSLSDNSASSEYLLAVTYPACTESVLVPGPWSMTNSDALQISFAILGVWVAAWAVRQIARVLFDASSNSQGFDS